MLIDIKNLSVSFKGGDDVQAVKDVSLEIYEKDKLAIIGETGSGKSVLLLSILRLLPHSAEVRGEIAYNAKDILKLQRKELDEIRGGQISYVPQGGGGSMNPLLTVGFQVGEPLIIHKKYTKKNAFLESMNLLKLFNIDNEKKRAAGYPHTLSGGMRQRALVAMGISAGAEIILADEPTKGLDEKRIEIVAESFSKLSDKTILCVTHDLNFARKISQRMCIMYSSYQIEEGPTEQIFLEPLHPYTMDIINAMPENGLKVNKGFTEDQLEEGCCYYGRCAYRTEKCKTMPPYFNVSGRKVRCWRYAS